MNDDRGSGDHGDEPFRFERNDKGDLVVCGEIDMLTAESLRSVLLADTDPIALDLSDVTFMDSSGVKLLVMAKQHREVRIVSASTAVSRVLELVGLRDEFT